MDVLHKPSIVDWEDSGNALSLSWRCNLRLLARLALIGIRRANRAREPRPRPGIVPRGRSNADFSPDEERPPFGLEQALRTHKPGWLLQRTERISPSCSQGRNVSSNNRIQVETLAVHVGTVVILADALILNATFFSLIMCMYVWLLDEVERGNISFRSLSKG